MFNLGPAKSGHSNNSEDFVSLHIDNPQYGQVIPLLDTVV